MVKKEMHKKQVMIKYFEKITLSSNHINFHRDFIVLVLEKVICNEMDSKGVETKSPLEVL